MQDSERNDTAESIADQHSTTTSQDKKRNHVLGWINKHIKNSKEQPTFNDKANLNEHPPPSKSVAATTTNVDSYACDGDDIIHPCQQTYSDSSNHSSRPPTIRISENEDGDVTEDDKASIRSKTASLISRHINKDHLNLFNMPYGLIHNYLRHGHRRHSSDDSASSKVPASSAATIAGLAMTPRHHDNHNINHRANSSSNVAHHHLGSGLFGNKWAHHRHSFSDPHSKEYNAEDSDSALMQRRSSRSQNYQRRTSSTHTGESSDRADSHQTWHSRESSVFSLPEYVDSPDVGFQKLQKDGDLVEWDELSTFLREEENGREEDFELPEWKLERTFTRTLVNNELIRLALNGLFLSPIQIHSKKHVLHVGCGKGHWCSNTASLFPNWLVVGIDDMTGGPSPDQRKVPKNFKYIRCYYDILRTLHDIPSESFDFIYVRFLLDSYSEDEYMTLIEECKRICKPHGFVEFHEMDIRIYGSPRPGACTHKLNGKVFQTMEQHGINPRLARKLGTLVQKVFERQDQKPLVTDSREVIQKKQQRFYTNYTSLPIGKWGGKLGVLFRDAIFDLYLDIKMHGYPETDASYEGSISSLSDAIPYDTDLETMARELESRKAFMNVHHVYARKSASE